MKVFSLLNNIVNRHSTLFIVNVLLLAILSIVIFIQCFTNNEAQSCWWFILIFGSSIFLPALIVAIFLTYKALYDTEQEFAEFRIHNPITKYIVFKIILSILFVIAWIFIIYLTCNCAYWIIENKKDIFFTLGILLMLSLIPFYWWLKKILYRIVSSIDN